MENESDADISISSWKTEDMNSDVDEFKNNVNKFTLEPIEKGFCGKKFKLKLQDKCFFKKQLIDDDNSVAQQALSSAFISCFSHTPYPVGKTYDDTGQSFLVWRYDDCQKKDNDNNEYNIFFNYNYIDEDKYNDMEYLKAQFCKMDKKKQKYAIMLHIHQFFFNLYDRKLENLILTDEKLIHIDLDRCFFLFLKEGETFKFKDKFCNLYDSLSKENDTLSQWKDETIKKINNIDYNIFIKRYIRNCIVFDIPCKTALNTLKTFVTKMEKFNEENDILKKESDNQWLSSLQKACKEFYYSFLNNAVIANISSDNFDKEFEELFQQAQNGNVILENKYSKENNINTQDKESKKENSINNVNNEDINQKKEEDDLKNSQMLNESNNININEDNNFDKTSNIIDEEQRTNLIKENNNISNINNEEKSTNSLKENNNDIQKKEQEAKPEEQLSEKLVEIDANNTNNKDKNESNIKADHLQDTNNILLQKKNTQIKTSNNIYEPNLKINPEIPSKYVVEINNKNSNETKPQDKNNKGPTFENENENHSTYNNQSSKWCLCQGCNCKCWPFN